MRRVRLAPASWFRRILALVILATFPLWWVVAWMALRPVIGFVETGKETLLSALDWLVFGE